jgi:hypothetical protein
MAEKIVSIICDERQAVFLRDESDSEAGHLGWVVMTRKQAIEKACLAIRSRIHSENKAKQPKVPGPRKKAIGKKKSPSPVWIPPIKNKMFVARCGSGTPIHEYVLLIVTLMANQTKEEATLSGVLDQALPRKGMEEDEQMRCIRLQVRVEGY